MGWLIGVILLGAIGAAIYFYITAYNELVTRRQKVKNAWAHIDAQLQRRFDLIPNLVETVKSFAVHEKNIVESVETIRQIYIQAQTNKEKMSLDAQLNAQLRYLYSAMEQYPQLQSNANFLQLQSALTEIEEDISYARQFYNDAVTIYNSKLMTFPSNIIASKHGFTEEALFDAVKAAEKAPQVFFVTKNQCPVCGAAVDGTRPTCMHCGSSLTQ